MTSDPSGEAAARVRRTDPRRAVAESELARSVLGPEPSDGALGGRAAAIDAIRQRDPRARLQAMSARLHGAAEQGLGQPEPDASTAPAGRRRPLL